MTDDHNFPHRKSDRREAGGAQLSRAVHLKMSKQAIEAHCSAQNIGISSIANIPTGGVRLVCMSVDGAAQIRTKLKSNLMKEDAENQRHGPGWGFVPRA